MTIANVKGMVVKATMVAVAAGAFLLAGPMKADAQGFAVGVRFGHPVGPVVVAAYPRGDFALERREEILRREALLRHEEWVRAHRFDRPYGHR